MNNVDPLNNAECEIFDLTGKKVFSKKGNRFIINILNWNVGVYYSRAINGGSYSVKRFAIIK